MAVGAAINLTATATDADSWKWMKGASNVTGATGTGNVATFTKASAVVGDTGNYKAVFTNAVGSVDSAVSVVTVA